jgi:hypothetical protein
MWVSRSETGSNSSYSTSGQLNPDHVPDVILPEYELGHLVYIPGHRNG